MTPILVDLALWLGGALLLLAAGRLLRLRVGPRVAALYLLLSALPWAGALLTDGHQVATDILHIARPWSAVHGIDRPANPLVSDPPLQMLPFRTLVRDRLLAGELPFWAGELGTGQPLLGNAQSAPFAPLHLLALPVPPLRGLTVTIAWQTLLALLLTHKLLRGVGVGPGAAVLGSLTYAWSAYLFVWAYYPLAMAAAWLPGVLLGVRRICRDEPRGSALLVSSALGMALSGHPETLFHSALAAGAFGLVQLRSTSRPGRAAFRLAAAAGLAFLLAAPALLPVLEAIPESGRARELEDREEPVTIGARDPETLFFAFDPLRTGTPVRDTWRGPGNFAESASHFAGLLPLALALAALAVGPRGPVLAGAACLLAAAGPLAPVVDRLPVLADAANGRLRLFWVLAVAVAAAAVLDRLGERRVRWTVAATSLAVAFGALAVAPPCLGPRFVPVAIGLGVWLAALLVPRLDRRVLLGLAVAATALDLGSVGVPYNPVVPEELDLRPTPALEHLRTVRDGSPQPFRIVAEGWDMLPNAAAVLGLADVRPNDPMHPAFASEAVRRRLGGPDGALPALVPPDRADPGATLLGVRFRLTPRHRTQMRPPWVPAGTFADGRLWENPDAKPAFFVPPWVVPVASRDQALERLVRHPAPDRVALLEEPAPDAVKRRQAGEIALRPAGPNAWELEVRSAGDVVVVSNVSWTPGWAATVPGVRVRRSGGAFLALEVPAGTPPFEVRYRPVTWPLALGFFGLGVLLAVGAGLCHRWIGPAGRGPEPSPPAHPDEGRRGAPAGGE